VWHGGQNTTKRERNNATHHKNVEREGVLITTGSKGTSNNDGGEGTEPVSSRSHTWRGRAAAYNSKRHR